MTYDYLVIGAGLSGLTASVILARHGYRVALVEKADKTAPLVRGFSRNGVFFDTGFHYTGGLDEHGMLDTFFKYLGVAPVLEKEASQVCRSVSLRFIARVYGRWSVHPLGRITVRLESMWSLVLPPPHVIPRLCGRQVCFLAFGGLRRCSGVVAATASGKSTVLVVFIRSANPPVSDMPRLYVPSADAAAQRESAIDGT